MALFSKRTGASSDDCFHYIDSGYWTWLSTTFIEQCAGRDYDPYTPLKMLYSGGMRFLDVTIPQGATINSAYFKQTCNRSCSVTTVNTRIEGQASDNPATFSTVEDYDNRPRTTAYVNWLNIPAWTAETVYSSPDIKTIIQEIVNRPGWASGNALVVFWSELSSSQTKVNCNRSGYSYDGATSKAPLLEVDYTGGAPPAAAVDRGDSLTWVSRLRRRQLMQFPKYLRKLP